MPDPVEDQILANATAGDAEAFSLLYERYVRRIYTYIYYRTGHALEAEDLTAKVFHRAMGHIGSYRNIGLPFSAWLYRIAHNLVANWHRDQSRRHEVPLEEHTVIYRADHPESALEHDQERGALLDALRSLPADRQQLVILKFVERLSNAEVALIMGRSEGAIKSLYHRTLEALREEISRKQE